MGDRFPEDSDLPCSYRAAWGKCYFISENYVKAAEQFEYLLALGLGFTGGFLDGETETGIRSQMYLNAAECYEKGAMLNGLSACWKSAPKNFRTRGDFG